MEDLGFIIGLELQQIVLQSYQITFVFDKSVTLSVEQIWRLYRNGELLGEGNPQVQAGPIEALQKTIGTGITAYTWEKNKTLVISFSNDHKLALIKAEQYESYHFTGDGFFVVV
jgi:hypothetical protein